MTQAVCIYFLKNIQFPGRPQLGLGRRSPLPNQAIEKNQAYQKIPPSPFRLRRDDWISIELLCRRFEYVEKVFWVIWLMGYYLITRYTHLRDFSNLPWARPSGNLRQHLDFNTLTLIGKANTLRLINRQSYYNLFTFQGVFWLDKHQFHMNTILNYRIFQSLRLFQNTSIY